MKRSILTILLALIFFSIPLTKGNAYAVIYKEEWYKLFHTHYQQYPDDCSENIFWLEKAAKADYCNPQFLGFKVETEKQWEKYRYLFQMHINLKIIEQYMRMGRIYDKKIVLFYDAPYKDEYQRNLEKTLACYETALYYWTEAKVWYEKANESKFRFLFIEARQNWEDERERIFTGELNYEKICTREINRVKKNLEELKQMDYKY
ncbi:MAG: hypothetical protein MJ162_02240 [Treponema sp.]|nr:hypothetical protein [Treponema sp.]